MKNPTRMKNMKLAAFAAMLTVSFATIAMTDAAAENKQEPVTIKTLFQKAACLVLGVCDDQQANGDSGDDDEWNGVPD